MPVLFSDHLPLPSLKSYCLLSIVFLASGFLYAKNESSSGENSSSHGTEQLHSSINASSFIGKESVLTWVRSNLSL